jgi:hypothetical protein
MVPPGQTQVNPAVNAVQSLVVQQEGSRWRIHLFQNTPAAFHGRPEAAAALTSELQRQAGAAAQAGSGPAEPAPPHLSVSDTSRTLNS